MNRRSLLVTLTLVIWVAADLAGCGRSPRVNYYILEPVAKAEMAGPVENGPAISIAAITLPEIVDRPQLVMRVDDARVDILEMHRWAEPLKSALPRLLAENLGNFLGTTRVSSHDQKTSGEADFRIVVDIRRFESTADAVTVDAVWSVQRISQGTQKTGRSRIVEPRGKEGFEALAAAYSRALASVSKEIALAIRAR